MIEACSVAPCDCDSPIGWRCWGTIVEVKKLLFRKARLTDCCSRESEMRFQR